MKIYRAQAGMTLIEVLVALAILGLVAGAMLVLIGQNARFVAAAEERLVAGVVADNKMVEALAAAGPLERGEQDSEEILGDAAWEVRRVVTETGVAGVVRIDLSVRRAGSTQVLASASTLKAEK